jgi:hypothetical protein
MASKKFYVYLTPKGAGILQYDKNPRDYLRKRHINSFYGPYDTRNEAVQKRYILNTSKSRTISSVDRMAYDSQYGEPWADPANPQHPRHINKKG